MDALAHTPSLPPLEPTGLQRALVAHLEAITQIVPKIPGRRYNSLYQLVLETGRWYEPLSELPEDIEEGVAGHCFANAARLAAEEPRLAYVEGFAFHARSAGLAVHHAWCTDGARAIDPTWIGDGLVYLGIPLTEAFRRRVLARRKTDDLVVLEPQLVDGLLEHGLPTDAVNEPGPPGAASYAASARPA